MKEKRGATRAASGDTFIVRRMSKDGTYAITKTSKLPNGNRVHSLDRKSFEKAVAAAMHERVKV